jgi:hypothetical protein
MSKPIYYDIIEQWYGAKRTKRSGVLLMNHINEGLAILDALGVAEPIRSSFALHPVFQSDDDLRANMGLLQELDPMVVALVMEYRNIANRSLSDIVGYQLHGLERRQKSCFLYRPIKLSPIKAVNDMLIADKVQNYKDFLKYHKDTHARSTELDYYFREWLGALKVSKQAYNDLVIYCKET